MARRIALVITIAVVPLLMVSAGLLAAPGPAADAPQAPAASQSPAETRAPAVTYVTLTAAGFAPAVVTVPLGSQVIWHNATNLTHSLQSGQPAAGNWVYLPLVERNSAHALATPPGENAATAGPAQGSATVFSATLPPGGNFSYTFQEAGDFPYFLSDQPQIRGRVVVQAPLQPDFRLGVSPPQTAITRGHSTAYTLTVTSLRGFSQAVSLAVGGQPAGALIAWGINPLTPTAASRLVITPAANGPTGTFTLHFTGTDGSLVHTTTATLDVFDEAGPPPPDFRLNVWPATRVVTRGHSTAYTLTVTGLHGFTQTVALAVGGAPGGTEMVWQQPTNQAVTLVITPAANGPTGTFTLHFTGTAGSLVRTTSASLEVTAEGIPPQPDFELTVGPATRVVTRGHAVSYSLGIQAMYGFSQVVSLAVSGQPTGTDIRWQTTNQARPDQPATLVITPAAASPTGAFTLHFTGTAGSLAHSANAGLIVLDEDQPVRPDFWLTVSPVSRSVVAGGTAIYQVSLAALYGFTPAVTLTAQPQPSGASLAWGQNPLPPDASTDLALTTSSATPAGLYTLTVAADGGNGLVHTQTITLSVSSFLMGVAPSTLTVTQGQALTCTLYLTDENDFGRPVQVALAGIMPTGVQIDWQSQTLTPTTHGVLTFTTALTSLPGVYALTLTGQGSGLVRQVGLTLTLLARPDFGLEIAPPTLAITQAEAGSVSVLVASRNGFDQAVTLSVSGLPQDAAATLEKSTLTPPDQTTLTLTVAANTPPGDYRLTVTGMGGGRTHTDSLNLTILAGQPDLVIDSIQLQPSAPIKAENALISLTIRNQSAIAAGPFQVDIYVDPPTQPGLGDQGLFSQTIAGLAPFGEVGVTAIHAFAQAGDHTLWAQADSTGQATEKDEDNNIAGPLAVAVVNSIEQVCGTLNANTTWYGRVVYEVTCDVLVPAGVTLTVQPDAIVHFASQTGLKIDGTLLAVGSSGHSILFTSGQAAPAPGDWKGLYVGATGLVELAYANISYGGNPAATGAILANVYVHKNGTAQLNHVHVAHSQRHGIRIFQDNATDAAHLSLSDSLIERNGSDGLHVEGSAGSSVITVSASQFISNSGYAAYLTPKNLGVLAQDNTGWGNGWNGIGLGGTLVQSTVLAVNPELPYILLSSLQELKVPAGLRLSAAAGSVVKMSDGARLFVSGELLVEGRPGQPVYFTSLRDDTIGGDSDGTPSTPAGNWRSLYIDSGGQAHLAYAVLRYGGKMDHQEAALYLRKNAQAQLDHVTISASERDSVEIYQDNDADEAVLAIRDSRIEASARYGIYAHYNVGGLSRVTISQTHFVSNTDYAVYLMPKRLAWWAQGNTGQDNTRHGLALGGALAQDTSLVAQPGFPYVLLANLNELKVPTGTKLNILAGNVIKMSDGARLSVSGELHVAGTSSQPVYFTSVKDDALWGDTNGDGDSTPIRGDWRNLRLETGGRAEVSHTQLRYGGKSDFCSFYLDSNSALALDNSKVSSGQGDAILLKGSNARLDANQVTLYNNGDSGVQVDVASQVAISNSTIYSNTWGIYNANTASSIVITHSNIYSHTQYGIRNDNNTVSVQAANNWWGAASGPTHSSNPGGSGDRVSDRVNFTPWLGAPVERSK